MLRYIFVIIHFSFLILWPLASGTTAIDLTVIGHIKGWRAFKYPKWMSAFIDENRFGYEIVRDCKTHPQVVIKLAFDFVLLVIGVVLSVLFMLNEKRVPTWAIATFDFAEVFVFVSYLVCTRIAATRVKKSASVANINPQK